MKHRFAVVLPAYNEEAGLETLLWRIVRAVHEHEYEIIVVDDGSTDRTAAIAERLSSQIPLHLIRHPENRGYGAAIRTGMLAARERAEIIVTMDADDSHDPSLIPLMLYGIECGSDLIVASRFIPGGREVGVPIHRMVLSRGAAVVFGRLLAIRDVHDYTSGYRAYRSTFVDRLVELLGSEGLARENGFTVGVELLLKADRAGGRLAEVPLVLRYDRKRSDSKLNIRRTMRDYVSLLRRVREESPLGGEPEPTGPPPRARGARWALGDGVIPTALVDVAAIFISFAAAFLLYDFVIGMGWLDRGPPSAARYAGLAGLLGFTTVVTFWFAGLYAPRPTELYLKHLQMVASALTFSVGWFFGILFFLTGRHPSRMLVTVALVLAYPLVLLGRRAMNGWLRRRRLATDRVGHALIYGAGETGQLLMRKVCQAPRLGIGIVGFLDDTVPVGTEIRYRESQMSDRFSSANVLGTGDDLERVAREAGATDLFVALPDIADARISMLEAEATRLGLDFGIIPRLGRNRPDRLVVEDFGAIPVLRLAAERTHGVYEASKRVLDLAVTALLAPLALPVGLLTAAAVLIDGRPVLFRQTRIGKSGRTFTMLKFRTMRVDTPAYAKSPSSDSDPRITRIGRLVRVAGLDELPQLINVWRGEMSLVGPRPEMPHIVATYGELARERLKVKPGITGLWQLSPNRTDSIHENLEYDLYYLRQRRLSFDLLILGETVLFVFRALARSAVEVVREVVGRERLVARRDELAAGSPASEDFVFVALDQRQRPDEPVSWRKYVPSVPALTAEHRVKVLAAERNAPRLRELTGDQQVDSSRIEYVSYREFQMVGALAREARVVITDVPRLAAAASAGRAEVLVIDHGALTGAPAELTDLGRKVWRAFDGPSGGLRIAQ